MKSTGVQLSAITEKGRSILIPLKTACAVSTTLIVPASLRVVPKRVMLFSSI